MFGPPQSKWQKVTEKTGEGMFIIDRVPKGDGISPWMGDLHSSKSDTEVFLNASTRESWAASPLFGTILSAFILSLIP